MKEETMAAVTEKPWRKGRRLLILLYCAAALLICVFPAVSMLWTSGEDSAASAENRTLAARPALWKEDGTWNLNILSDAGAYFEDHFGDRAQLVTADALLKSELFGVSSQSGVITGKKGWLYYADSLDDYMGTSPMSDRALFNIAHTLAMTRELLSREDVSLVFAVAPNKNTIYPEYMPCYYTRADGESNLDRLKRFLEAEKAPYADLKQILSERRDSGDSNITVTKERDTAAAVDYDTAVASDREGADLLYHKLDSHWNNLGAALAADAIFEAAEKEHENYSALSAQLLTPEERTGGLELLFPAKLEGGDGAADIGDLERMLYPALRTETVDYFFETFQTFAYVGEIGSTFDPKIQAVNPSKAGSLLMFRDSFGNALVPFFAQEYAASVFSRGVPYHFSDLETLRMLAPGERICVVIERAERFLPNLAQNPPVLAAPFYLPEGDELEETDCSDFELTWEGDLLRLSGVADSDKLWTESRIFVQVDHEMIYEAFPASFGEGETAEDTGFVIYFASGQADEDSTFTVLALST